MAAPPQYHIPETEYQLQATRSSGPGGQHVNKTSTAVILRFDIVKSSLPEEVKARLLAMRDARVTESGIVIIRVETHRSQFRNKSEAIEKLEQLVARAAVRPKRRVPTRRTKASVEERLKEKAKHSEKKAKRRKEVEP